MSTSSTVAHHERLWPGPLGWSFVVGFAGLVTIAMLPVRPAVAMAVGGATLLAGLAVGVRTSALVSVRDGELTAGPAHIPVHLLGPARVLDRTGVRAALGPGSDARAFVCLRAWIPGAVEIEVQDPDDPTPTWLISTRDPARLVAAIDDAKG